MTVTKGIQTHKCKESFSSAKLRRKLSIQVDWSRYATGNELRPWKKTVKSRNAVHNY
jgi:hypothetical protein